MADSASSPNPCPLVRRAFEFSRLESQLLALAYQQLLPIIRSPMLTTKPRLACLVGGGLGGPTSFQEEQDLE